MEQLFVLGSEADALRPRMKILSGVENKRPQTEDSGSESIIMSDPAPSNGGSHHHWRCRLRGGRRGRDRRLSPVVRARSFYAGWLIGLAAASHHVTLAPGVGERCGKSRMSPQANCARPWPTDQFSFADSRTFTNTSSGRMPGFSPSNSAVRRNRAFFCFVVRVSNTVIWM